MAQPVVTVTTLQRSSGAPSSLTFQHASDGNPLFVDIELFNLRTVQSVTFNGAPLTQLASATSGANPLRQHEVWYLAVPDVVTANIVITLNLGVFHIAMARSVRDAKTTGEPITGFVVNGAGSGTAASVVVGSNSDGLVLDFVGSSIANQTFAEGADQTLDAKSGVENNTEAKGAGSHESGAALTTMSWTLGTTGAWYHSAYNVPAAQTEHAPVYKAAGTLTEGVGDISVPWPSGHQLNDFGLLLVESAGGEAVATPGGWSEINNSPQATGAGTAGTRLTAFYRKAAGSNEPNVTLTDAGDHLVARILTFRHVHTASPIVVTSGSVKAVANATLSNAGPETNDENCLVVFISTQDTDGGVLSVSAWANATLGSVREISDNSAASGNGGCIFVGQGIKSLAGVTGTMTATTSGSGVNANLAIALRPAPGVPVPGRIKHFMSREGRGFVE